MHLILHRQSRRRGEGRNQNNLSIWRHFHEYVCLVLVVVVICYGPKSFASEHLGAIQIDSENSQKSAPIIPLERVFKESQPLFNLLPTDLKYHRISWQTLRSIIRSVHHQSTLPESSLRLAIQWVDLIEKDPTRISEKFNGPFEPNEPYPEYQGRYLRAGNALITPDQNAMWRHCETRFETLNQGWNIFLAAGYRSPAFETIVFSQRKGRLSDLAREKPMPYYSGHQKIIPDISVILSPKEERPSERPPWSSLYTECSAFGFTPAYPEIGLLKGELRFSGVEPLYLPILYHQLVPRPTAIAFMEAMKKTDFFPSPEGLRMLIALSAQESSIRWNPRLNQRKKRYLKDRFNMIFDKIENSFSGAISNLLLSTEHRLRKQRIITELNRITDPVNKQIYEFDFYIWTLDVKTFFKDLVEEHQRVTRLGQWFFELEAIINQISYEPQTFGFWQVNINHLIEKIEAKPKLRREFSEIYTWNGTEWIVNRHSLVEALSGMPFASMSRQKTLELLIRTYIKPRYQSHIRGYENDLLYFLAENISGEMSTYRAAIQAELNRQLGLNLVLDGDLSYYLAYSTQEDWSKISQTQIALSQFIRNHPETFPEAEQHQNYIRTLCKADTWEALKESLLYRRIMGAKTGQRIFPQIKSDFYQQTAEEYANRVKMKSKLFH